MLNTKIETWLRRVAEIVTAPDDKVLIEGHISTLTGSSPDAPLAAFEIVRIAGESGNNAQSFEVLIDVPDVAARGDRALVLALAAIGASLSGALIDWRYRDDAVAARDAIAEVGQSLYAYGDVLGSESLSFLRDICGQACRLLSDRAANLNPLVRVEVGFSLPSSVLAYRLYGDAARAENLVAVAGVATPFVMPSSFIAEAPDAT